MTEEKHPLEEKWQPTPVFLPEESHEQRSLVSHSTWGHRGGHDWVSEHSRVERELHHLLKVTPGGQRDPFLKSKSCWPVPFQEDTFGEKRSTGKSVTGHGSLSSSGQLLGHVRLLGTPWTGAWQASLSITNSWSLLKLLLKLLSRWYHPTISFSVVPFSSCPQSFPAPGSLLIKSALLIRWPKYWEFQLQHQSFQWTPRTDLWDGLVGSPCNPRNSQESSPTPQFKSINSSVLSFLYSPTLSSIHDYWKNHSFD